MAITIKGIRIESFTIVKDAEKGVYKIDNAAYSLISSTDAVLAKQTIGGYGGMTLEASAPTVKALQEFVRMYKGDVEMVLGLEEVSK